MHLLHTLRHARLLARWVLLWWCMALGVAAAAPWVQPAQHTLVCSASGSVTLQDTGAPDAPVAQHLDCVLCLSAGAPPCSPASVALAASESPSIAVYAASPSGPRRTSAPPPGRGPPQA